MSYQISNCYLQLYLCSELVHASVTRGNYYKLVPQHCTYDLRKYYFTNRVVPVWNTLPSYVNFHRPQLPLITPGAYFRLYG